MSIVTLYALSREGQCLKAQSYELRRSKQRTLALRKRNHASWHRRKAYSVVIPASAAGCCSSRCAMTRSIVKTAGIGDSK